MHIFLTGFMGCGKSTVGRIIEKTGGMELFDTDQKIEQLDGRRISRIFEESGEGYFRRLESMILTRLLEHPPCVVSCGGGMVLRRENTDIMKRCGSIVYLRTSPETILGRVMHSSNRPLLEGNKNIEYITGLMRGRTPYYEEAADITIDTDGKEADEVAKAVLNALK